MNVPARARARVGPVLVALAVLAGLWLVVRWATGRPWVALLVLALGAGVAFRLVVDVPGIGPVVRSAGEAAARWVRDVVAGER